MKVEILDVGSGNVKSIKNCVDKCNVNAQLISQQDSINGDLLILPGVGAAGPYMNNLKINSFDKKVQDYVSSGGRLLGICLGFQILCVHSEENGGVQGLGIINGSTKKIGQNISHNGWEEFKINKDDLNSQTFNSNAKLTRKKIVKGRVFYNHEYGVEIDNADAFKLLIPGKDFSKYTAMYINKKIIGIQFHPEKSQVTGYELMKMVL